jgi:hypothetical protein
MSDVLSFFTDVRSKWFTDWLMEQSSLSGTDNHSAAPFLCNPKSVALFIRARHSSISWVTVLQSILHTLKKKGNIDCHRFTGKFSIWNFVGSGHNVSGNEIGWNHSIRNDNENIWLDSQNVGFILNIPILTGVCRALNQCHQAQYRPTSAL